MTVKELIEALQKEDPDATPVVAINEAGFMDYCDVRGTKTIVRTGEPKRTLILFE